MDDYSIETRSANIYDSKTKEYFSEVVSSYQQSNYRSATVMLWSVAVCDLLHKLKHLVDMYGDTTATSILDEIKRLQNTNPKSSEWESRLVELVAEKTQLLEMADVDHLRHLQQQRHLAAHPVLLRDFELHRPNRETVRALIRNTLDGLLTKPPIYTQKVFSEFISDLSSSAPILIKDHTLRTYLESKYLCRADKKLELSFARSLWKLVFRTVNHDCDPNREINYRVLMILFERNKNDFVDMVRDDSHYFSNIAQIGNPVSYLVKMLSKAPYLYRLLTPAAHVVIAHEVESDAASKCLGWFTKESLQTHVVDVIHWLDEAHPSEIPVEALSIMHDISDSSEWGHSFRKICNHYYGGSWSYNMADARFRDAIEPYLNEYEEENLLNLLEEIENNSQCYERGGARRDHQLVKSKCNGIPAMLIDRDDYRNFFRSCPDR